LEEIRRTPRDMTAWLVYADWLEERGDERAAEIRQQCQWRLPLGEDDVAHLAAISAARKHAAASNVRVAIDMRAAPPYGIREPQTLAVDLQNLDALAIARNFPRDDEGVFERGASVLLAPYASDLGAGGVGGGHREAWLNAVCERTGEQCSIVVKVAERVSRHEPYNWSKTRWLWDRRAAGADRQQQWSFSPARLEKAAFFERFPRLEAMLRAEREGKLAEFDRQALCVLLLDEARFGEALALYGLRLAPSAANVLVALPSRDGKPSGAHLPSSFQPSWIPFLRRQLWSMAPWRMAELMRREQILARTRHGEVAPKRLTPLPDQPYAAKIALLLGVEEEGEPDAPRRASAKTPFRLFLETTNSQDRLAEADWKRPLEFDLARLGLAT
jgi:uncharacterized protein (TIGR02996 family)